MFITDSLIYTFNLAGILRFWKENRGKEIEERKEQGRTFRFTDLEGRSRGRSCRRGGEEHQSPHRPGGARAAPPARTYSSRVVSEKLLEPRRRRGRAGAASQRGGGGERSRVAGGEEHEPRRRKAAARGFSPLLPLSSPARGFSRAETLRGRNFPARSPATPLIPHARSRRPPSSSPRRLGC